MLGWMALAIYFDFSLHGPSWLRAGLGVLVPVGAVAALWLGRPRRWAFAGIPGAFVVVLAAWLAIPPSNERDWQPDVATLAFADIHGDRVILHNVRNAEYRTETDYTMRLEDRALDLSQLRSLDFFLIHWGSPLIAHTIMSWGFEGDRYLAISIETRKEKGEQYSALRGFFRQYSSSSWSRTSATSCASARMSEARTSTSTGSTCPPRTLARCCSGTSRRSTSCASGPSGTMR
jgi:hypothetical protein